MTRPHPVFGTSDRDKSRLGMQRASDHVRTTNNSKMYRVRIANDDARIVVCVRENACCRFASTRAATERSPCSLTLNRRGGLGDQAELPASKIKERQMALTAKATALRRPGNQADVPIIVGDTTADVTSCRAPRPKSLLTSILG